MLETPSKRLVVEGWRGICHSYAVVNQWQLLSLRKKAGLELYLREAAVYNQKWMALNGLFPEEAANYLAGLQDCGDLPYDAEYRIAFPYNFKDLPEVRTGVFVTSEFKTLLEHQYASFADFRNCINRPEVKIITPSNWSAEAFYRQGCSDQQVVVIPHGVDPELFNNSVEKRQEYRQRLGLDGFVFMNVGAMTENKGIGLLLRAFAVVSAARPEARLVLKGADSLYPSTELLQKSLAELSVEEQERVISRCSYIANSLSMTDMAAMYQVADVYVSPYKAEGFNMPVLEALACGVPVICTRGGATDDFVTDECALRINSQLTAVAIGEYTGEMVVPDLDHLIALMFQAMDDHSWRQQAAQAAVAHVRERYSWDLVSNRLYEVLFDTV